jgi:hypothetical protein
VAVPTTKITVEKVPLEIALRVAKEEAQQKQKSPKRRATAKRIEQGLQKRKSGHGKDRTR